MFSLKGILGNAITEFLSVWQPCKELLHNSDEIVLPPESR